MSKNKILILLILILLFVSITSLFVGSSGINPSETIKIIINKIFNIDQILSSDGTSKIIWNIRFPRIVTAIIVGGCLALSGCAMQSLLMNPLASPFTLGVSTGASLGVATSVVFGVGLSFLGKFSLPFIGFLFAFLTVIFILFFVSKIDMNLSNISIILTGMIVSLFLNSILSLVIFFAKEKVNTIIFWQMGSLAGIDSSQILLLAIILLIGLIFLLMNSFELDMLSFGEFHATSMGLDVKKTKLKIMLISTLMTGACVSFTGTIGFVGLVSPHIVRSIIGSKHIYSIPASMLLGGILLVIADTIARTLVSPAELPVGTVTALIGAPFFAIIFLRRKGSN